LQDELRRSGTVDVTREKADAEIVDLLAVAQMRDV
jgi:hypothetical protein